MNTLTGSKRTRLALLLGSLGAMGPLTIDMYLPSFPTIASELGTSASSVQLSLTACLLGLGIGQLIMGPMSDVHGRKRPLVIALIAYAIASFAIAFSPNIYFLIGARFLQGFAASAGIVISRAIVRDSYSGRELTKFFALLMLVSNLAPILAPIAGSTVLLFTNWNGIFVVLSIIGILLFFLITSRLEETLPEERRVPSNIGQTLKNFQSLVADRQFLGYALAQGFMIAGVFAYVSGTPFVYQNIYGVSPQVFSYLFGLNGIGLIIGTQSVGRLSHKVSERQFLLYGLSQAVTAGAVLTVAVLVNGPFIAIAIPLFFFVMSIGMVATASFSLAMQTQGHIAGSASAFLGMLPLVLGSLTAPLVGIAGEDTAVPMGLIILTASLLALGAYFGLARRAEKKTDELV
ncbi:Bcr/CflA family multidrug efflux MFS transporter [Jeotgalibacillus sp. R-1-5s-1]|uniref:Bcr/CflA family multidrug efflux MFS transporter n=1 Tax=Jeotgalibacillus sp. R-1-5s-1 TaxID=2555897 RepID=UPI00106AE460|nr:Bcr/CflA family multidrug efflux MFS transporter [Jeotgalibacillus sp. R-1-5s-1]TFE00780.1 Bcr/CflA family multidrug efflux MFS transporter [Jeotgalibacillus sp. R-1-5s-1]